MKKVFFIGFLLCSCATPMTEISPPSLVSQNYKGPNVIRFELKNPSSLGKAVSGQNIKLGGFSGLRYLGRNSDGKYRFLTHTDRGPNPEPYTENGKSVRPFLLPKFQPRIIYLEADPKTELMEVVKEIPLTNSDGRPLTGIPQNSKQENPVDNFGKSLPFDPNGMDLEGIALADDGSFWMVEEYGPSILHFSPQGRLLELLRPESGLPKVLKFRRTNRGFEGATRYENSLFAMMQSPLDNPQSDNFANSKKSQIVRLLEVDLVRQSTSAQYAYVLESNKIDKIGDIASVSRNKLLVIEQDGKMGADSSKKVYLVNLQGATNLQLLSEKFVGPNGSLETMNPKDWKKNKIVPVQKREILDLKNLGVMEEKVEGIDLVDSKFVAVVVDNDFGVGGDLDQKTGLAKDTQATSALYLFPIDGKILD